MTIALVTPVLNDGDAVGNDILGMAETLRSAGHTVRFYAEKARVPFDVFPLSKAMEALDSQSDFVIDHHSVQCDAAVRLVAMMKHRAIVKYHNVTPALYFEDVNPDAIRGAELGRQQAVRLARTGARFWVDSKFNAADLARELPGLEMHTIPPFHATESLIQQRPDLDLFPGLDDWTTTLLCVGRVAPNKNLELAVETLAAVRNQVDPQARLVLAGEHIFPTYSDRVRQRAESLGVTDSLIVTGRISSAQLKALYRLADLLLVTSDHEGFCVPLVEAMGLGLPVVAVPHTAIPETGGEAIRYAEPDGESLAMAVKELLQEGDRREHHVAVGYRRYREQFSRPALERRFWELWPFNPGY